MKLKQKIFFTIFLVSTVLVGILEYSAIILNQWALPNYREEYTGPLTSNVLQSAALLTLGFASLAFTAFTLMLAVEDEPTNHKDTIGGKKSE